MWINRYKKNGHTRHGKQNHQCKACGRQFVATAEDRLIAAEQRTRIEHLLRERISLRGICRAVGVSLTWLLHFMVECFTACPDDLHVQLPARPTAVVMSRLEAEADEMWSFVQKKANKQWIWIAMDADNPPDHCVSRGGSESGEWQGALGQYSAWCTVNRRRSIRTNMTSIKA